MSDRFFIKVFSPIVMVGVWFTFLSAATAQEKIESKKVLSFSGAFLAGYIADLEQDYKPAALFYEKALSMSPDAVVVRRKLIISLIMTEEFNQSVKYAEQLKNDKLLGNLSKAILALEAIKKNKYKSAQKILFASKSNKIATPKTFDINHVMDTMLIAWVRAGLGNGREALEIMCSIKGNELSDILRDYEAGILAIYIKDFKAARNHLNNAIHNQKGAVIAQDTFLRSVISLVTLESSLGNKQKALEALSFGESLVEDYAPFNILRNKIEKGIKISPQVLTVTKGAASVVFSIGSALSSETLVQGIENLYLRAAYMLDPEDDDTLILLAQLEEKSGNTDRAIEFYQKIPESSPIGSIALMKLALNLAEKGKVDEGEKCIKRLIKANPKEIRNYIAYGNILYDAKRYDELVKNYDSAVKLIGQNLNTSYWQIFFQRGVAYEKINKWPEAEANFLKALQLKPDQPQVLNYLGYSWIERNIQLEKSTEMIKKALEFRPDDGYFVDSLGWAYFRLGKFEEAVNQLEKAVLLRPSDPNINDHLGDAYWKVGRKLEASYQWNHAIIFSKDEIEISKIKDKLKKRLDL
ncbi:hypothetical protein B488_00700 [Liberibacter crescens BT-1]|uniref:TPR domain protein n=1 Tax=Liberibacter crescens (strain BT-1) TaxID=1215343 RepID=L0ETV3_LIBCB|nr:tetratricopeptide repeat protein [Liberibacter crescens]AGA64063.1 hypothetical protein B488_00700 [Liberibacter crescens BT-1]